MILFRRILPDFLTSSSSSHTLQSALFVSDSIGITRKQHATCLRGCNGMQCSNLQPRITGRKLQESWSCTLQSIVETLDCWFSCLQGERNAFIHGTLPILWSEVLQCVVLNLKKMIKYNYEYFPQHTIIEYFQYKKTRTFLKWPKFHRSLRLSVTKHLSSNGPGKSTTRSESHAWFLLFLLRVPGKQLKLSIVSINRHQTSSSRTARAQ